MNFGLTLKILGKVILVYKLINQNLHPNLFDCIINTPSDSKNIHYF